MVKRMLLIAVIVVLFAGCIQTQTQQQQQESTTPTSSKMSPTPATTSKPANITLQLGGENYSVKVEYGKNRSTLTVDAPGEGILSHGVLYRANWTKEDIRDIVWEMLWRYKQDELLAVGLEIQRVCRRAGSEECQREECMDNLSEACRKEANEFTDCIGEGKTPDECLKRINGSWKSQLDFDNDSLLYETWLKK